MSNELFRYNPLQHYQLIIDLPFIAKKKVYNLRRELHSIHLGGVVNTGLPLIYLADFKQYESQELTMTDALNRIALGFMPFKIHLKNFGHTNQAEIFVPVENNVPINILVSRLKETSSYLIDAKFNEQPRVSIIKRIHDFQFPKSWSYFESLHFSATFIVAEMLLLKHITSINSWQILKRMDFQNLAIAPASPTFKP